MATIQAELVGGAPQSVRELWDKVRAFDLARERKIVGYRMSHSPEHAQSMEWEYRKYLFIRLMHKDEILPMSKAVDDFWHAHTLNTRSYQRFCEEVGAGFFIHHGPTANEEENQGLMPRYIEGTIVRLGQYFGKPDSRFWPTVGTSACCYCAD